IPAWNVRDVFGDPGSRRLVTVETRSTRPNFQFGGPAPIPLSEFRVSLWDTGALDESSTPIAVLDQWKAQTFIDHPLVALEPDGVAIAVARTRDRKITLHSGRTGKATETIETQVDLSALAMGPRSQLAE